MDHSSAASAHPTAPEPVPLQLSPSQLDDLVALKLREVCAGITEWKLPVTVVGVLGDPPPARYGGKLYRVPLSDPASPAAITYLNVREATLEQAAARSGDLVRATGTIVAELFKGAISFRLEVVAIGHLEPVAAPQVREKKTSVEVLRRLAGQHRPFPSKVSPTITLIHPAAS